VTAGAVSRTTRDVSNRLGWAWCAVGLVFVSGLIASCSDAATEDGPRAAAGSGSDQGGASSLGAGGAGGESDSHGGAPFVENASLGMPCTGASQCKDANRDALHQLDCVRADEDFPGTTGAPAHGLCTAQCESDADCKAFDASAVCGTIGEPPLTNDFATEVVPRVCLLGCSLGSHDGIAKCHDRPDLACRPFAPADSVMCQEDGTCPDGTTCYRARCRELACGPRCNSNADCEEGRSCDPYTGLCSENAADPSPIGSDCDAPTASCGGGNCLVLFDENSEKLKSMCTQSCTFGQICGEGKGACVMPRFQDFAAGDIAYCQATCNCDSDCLHEKDRCYPWASAAFVKHFGTQGVCDVGDDSSPTLDCGASGAGGASAGGASAGGAGGASDATQAGDGGTGG
jgi:hypothetical protein